MPAQRCPHCGLVNPASAMACDCGYSFVDGTPPRDGSQNLRAGGGAGSAFATRIAVRLVMMALGTGLLLAIRMCGSN